jgi:hypothetical protein
MLPFTVVARFQTDWFHGLPTVASSPRFHTDDRPDCLQISYAQNPNGRPYPFSFQSLVVPSSPSSPHEKPPIPFISSSLRTLFLATDGDTPPLPTAFSAKIRTERFRRRGLIFHRAPSFASSFQKSLAYRRFQPVGEDLAAHELPVTSSPRAESRGQK